MQAIEASNWPFSKILRKNVNSKTVRHQRQVELKAIKAYEIMFSGFTMSALLDCQFSAQLHTASKVFVLELAEETQSLVLK